MWQTIGHKNQKEFLEAVLSSGNTSHAYLFCGPKGVGKRTLAIEFAKKILKVSPEHEKSFNPDLMLLDQPQLKIEEMRSIISDLSLRPYFFEKKIAIIDNFENVTEEAASSILKTLEEPSLSSVLILIATNKKAILPTIISRTQVLNFNRLDVKEIAAIAKPVNIFDGKIGEAIRYRDEADFKEVRDAHAAEFQEIKNLGAGERIIKIKSFADLEPADLKNIFEAWLDAEHFKFIRENPRGYKNVSLLIEAIFGLKQNLNKKLVLEKLFLNIA